MEFYIHNIDETDIEEAVKVLRSPFLTTGKVTSLFEKKLASYLKIPHVVAVSSCTAALHIALLAFGIGEGDEVITTPMSFVATANAILHTGAKPVFVDIEPETGNIDPKAIETKITKKTKAIIPVHLYGVLCDMEKIYKIAKKNNLKIISDCAHSLESKRNNYNSSEYCDAACYSFYATKNLSCGEGGAIAVKDEKIADKLKILRLHGMSKSAIDRYTDKYNHYDVSEIGWKYNLDNIHSSLLINQLDRIENILIKRQELYKKYITSLKNIKKISFPEMPENSVSAHHLFVIIVNESEKRDYYIEQFQNNSVPVAVNFNPIHLMSIYIKLYGYKKGDFPNAEKFGSSIITLPFYTKLSESDFNHIIKTAVSIFK
ncbi:DegT/DnrJ/EryC1/StrS family aminotransferase [Candidatus Dependentiae bacterium]|nr:DegT/DnrJ/EryC1/StrS family aminotransferase [Candidatus Dependentiae bacterium]